MDYSYLSLSVTSANLLAASMVAKLLSHIAFEAAVRVSPVTRWANRSAKVDSFDCFFPEILFWGTNNNFH